MNGKEYIQTQMRIIEMGKIADSLDLDGFLKCISNAETVAPIIDPTMYLKAQKNLSAIKNMTQAAKTVKAAYVETYKAVIETAVAGFVEGQP